MKTFLQTTILAATVSLLILFQTSCETNPTAPPTGENPEAPAKKHTGNDTDFIGMKIEDAQALAKKRGLGTRISGINGKPQMLTMDYSESRINFDIQSGKVIKSSRG